MRYCSTARGEKKMASKINTKAKCWNKIVDICLLLRSGWRKFRRERQIQSVESSSQSRALSAGSERVVS